MLSWQNATDIIASRQLKLLIRSPDQLRTYQAAKLQYEQTHGSTAAFIIEERLKWTGDGALVPADNRFLADARDLKILENDFSYYFEPGIRHFVVWSKVRIPCDATEFPTPQAARDIERFLATVFVDGLGVPRANIAWFKNTGALQSVPSLSHFHVLVRECNDELASKIINRL